MYRCTGASEQIASVSLTLECLLYLLSRGIVNSTALAKAYAGKG